MNKHTEIRFEETIEQYLIETGDYAKCDPKTFDATRGLFSNDVISFIKSTQNKNWQALVDFYGSKAQKSLIDSLCKELASKGSLNVLRHGFKCFGKKFKMAYFAPNSKMNQESLLDYAKNNLNVIRQVHFD